MTCSYIDIWQIFLGLYHQVGREEQALVPGWTKTRIAIPEEIFRIRSYWQGDFGWKDAFFKRNDWWDIQELSVNFIKYSGFSTSKSSLIYFTGILGFDIYLHRWHEPSLYTQVLAKIQFCIWVIILEYATTLDQRDNLRNTSPNPLSRFRRIHASYLVEGKRISLQLYS